MKKYNFLQITVLLLVYAVSAAHAHTEPDQVEIYRNNRFALGIGAAVVMFDTKVKFTDKQSGNSIFLDPEGNLDLPEISHVTTFYGGWNINPKHSLSFSFFNINRESIIIDIDETFEDVSIVGNAKISDTTDFYQLTYGYTLFVDGRSKIKFIAGIYGLDLKYVFEAEGQITEDGVTLARFVYEEANVFAPLPLIGLDFWYSFTPEWALNTKVSFVAGHYEDVSAGVLQTTINAQYRFTDHIGLMFGMAYFDSDVEIEDDVEKIDINYGYNGGYIGMHFIF